MENVNVTLTTAVAYPDFVEVAVITHVPAPVKVITSEVLLTKLQPAVPVVEVYLIVVPDALELGSALGVSESDPETIVELVFDGVQVSVCAVAATAVVVKVTVYVADAQSAVAAAVATTGQEPAVAPVVKTSEVLLAIEQMLDDVPLATAYVIAPAPLVVATLEGVKFAVEVNGFRLVGDQVISCAAA